MSSTWEAAPLAFKIADGYVEVSARVDRKQVRGAARRAGQDGGRAFSDSFDRTLAARTRRASSWIGQWRKAFQKAIPANLLTFVPIFAAVGTAVAGATAAIFGLVSSLGQAMGAAAGAVTALAGVAGVAYTLFQAFKNLNTGPFKDFKKNLDGLSARAVKAAKPAFDELFGALNRHFHAFNMLVRKSGVALRGFSSNIAAAFDERGLGDKLVTMFARGADGAHRLTAALANIVESLITLGAAAGPIFVRFASWLNRVTFGWRQWLNEAERTGELTRILNLAGDELSKWGQILGNLLSGLVGMFAGAAVQGRQLADALLSISQRFREWGWSEETHGKIQRLLEFFMTLDYGKIFRIAAGITAMGLAFKTMVGVASIIQGLLMLASLGPVGVTLTIIAVAVGLLAAAFVRAWTTSEQFRTAMSGLWEDFKGKIQPAIDNLRGAIAEHLLPAWDRLKQAVIDNRDELMTLAGWIASALITAVAVFVEELAGMVTVLAGVVTAVGAVVRAWDTAKALIGTAILAVIDAVQGLMNSWLNAFDSMLSVAIAVARRIAPGMVPGLVAAQGKVRDFRAGANREINAIKTKVKTTFFAETARATAAIHNLKRLLASVPRTMRTTHYVTSLYRQEQAQANRRNRTGGIAGMRTGGMAGGRAGRKARGGMGSGWTWVGEDGPELAKLPPGTQVRNKADSARQAPAAAAGAAATQRVLLQLDPTGRGSRLEELFVEWFRHAVRTRGGDVQSVLGSN